MESIPPDPPDPPDPMDISPAGSSLKRRHDRKIDDGAAVKKAVLDKDLQSSSSSFNLYTHPCWVMGIKAYTDDDKGPFIVHVSQVETDLSSGVVLKPLKFGQFLHNNKVANICSDGVKKVGRNRISVQFKTGADANRFLDNPILVQQKFTAVIPTFNITKMGIVRGVPIDLSMDDFVGSLILPKGVGDVMKARRMNRKVSIDGKVSWIPTQSVVITFHGQILPQRIFCFYSSLQVDPYKYPTIQCVKCCRFGHIQSQCRSKPRCYRCAQPHAGDSCDVEVSAASCLHCSGNHFANSKCCPEWGRQEAVKILMSQDSLSYEDASARYPKTRRPYSEVSQSSYPSLSPSFQPSQSISQPSSSYVKTVFSSPRPRAPLGKSYDKKAHQAIIAEVPSTSPNGVALLANSSSFSAPSSQNDNLVNLLVSLLISILSNNNTNLPSNVANKITDLLSLLNNGFGSPSVEPQKHSSQEA